MQSLFHVSSYYYSLMGLFQIWSSPLTLGKKMLKDRPKNADFWYLHMCCLWVFLPLLIFAVNGVLRQCASNIVQGDHLSRMSGHDQTKWDREWVRQDCSHQRLSQLRFALENSLNKSLCICTTSLCDSMTSLVNLKPSRRFTQKATCEVEGRHDRSVCHSTRCSNWVSCGIQSFYLGEGGTG